MAAAGKITAIPSLIAIDAPQRGFLFSGSFSRESNSAWIHSVAPGTYLAEISYDGPQMEATAAYPAVGADPHPAYREPAVRKKLMACGQVITVRPGDQLRLSLTGARVSSHTEPLLLNLRTVHVQRIGIG